MAEVEQHVGSIIHSDEEILKMSEQPKESEFIVSSKLRLSAQCKKLRQNVVTTEDNDELVANSNTEKREDNTKLKINFENDAKNDMERKSVANDESAASVALQLEKLQDQVKKLTQALDVRDSSSNCRQKHNNMIKSDIIYKKSNGLYAVPILSERPYVVIQW
ncbi:hypothetical protein RFI_09888 [Reticulomyxa filosa]|uniref:Uncharacterized protein n=1 Tax=Reticulomyxa filosa TaxID=46433 RepID=X6NNE2_RETFI|nr:hypothetical protein RFI_09888 [Reticulomyxa filosa]|eukprot:ETO27239.1 hypothetical protein RFI_09888 [Reticulomyxa filosa]